MHTNSKTAIQKISPVSSNNGTALSEIDVKSYSQIHANIPNRPLVTCIMPTGDRPEFAKQAIHYFLKQDYPNRELLVVDDGNVAFSGWIPDDKRIRYVRLDKKQKLGTKRNICVEESRSDLIMHWDDDDWYASNRISYQIDAMLKKNAEVCGLQQMLFYHSETKKAWLYKYPNHGKTWLAGGSLLYTKDFWKQSPFPDIQRASDTKFIWSRNLKSYAAHEDFSFYVAMIHRQNTSPKNTGNHLWNIFPVEDIKNLLREDYEFYTNYPAKSKLERIRYNKNIVTKTNSLNAINTSKFNQIEKSLAQDEKLDLKKEHRNYIQIIDFKESNITSPKSNVKNVAILLTTYKRQTILKQILKDLKKEKTHFKITCFIIDDEILGNGKRYYWKTINMLWDVVKNQNFDYYIQLPDDIKLTPKFIEKAINNWENIQDSKKVCLNLLLDDERLGRTNWTGFWPVIKDYNGNRYLKTQWVDMFFICEKKFFEQLKWKLNPISLLRWNANPTLSSGVGQQISIRLNQHQWNLYQVTNSLAEHIGSVSSVMNPEIRTKSPIRSTQLSPVYGGIASIPSRENLLKNTISSIADYMDHIFLFLNDYPTIPEWIKRYSNITSYLSKIENTNKGDAGKFYGLNQIKEKDYYYFTFDDDMIYPADYIWKMITKIENYKRRSVVGCGGYIMKSDVNNFYSDRLYNWHINDSNNSDRPVHILHTCLTAWHSSALKFNYDDCIYANMGDIWLAKAAQEQNVSMILIERPPKWVEIQNVPLNNTIYGLHKNKCKTQTEVYNSHSDWQIAQIQSA